MTKELYIKPRGRKKPKGKKSLSVQAIQIYCEADQSVYVKPPGRKVPLLIFIISGGTKTEPGYLDGLSQSNKKVFLKSHEAYFQATLPNQLSHIVCPTKGKKGTEPKHLVGFWNKTVKPNHSVYKDNNKVSYRDIDKSYYLTDLDHFRVELQQELSKGYTEGDPQWIISNPCFEIWLYYCHYRELSYPHADLCKLQALNETDRPKELKELCNSLDPKIRQAKEQGKKAISTKLIRKVKQYYAEDKYGIPKLFGTQVYLLAREISKLWS